MSARSSAGSNPQLTNYAQGLSQDLASAMANFIAPPVPVAATIGHYKSFDSKNAFQVVDTARAVGGPAKRLEFDADDPTYNCQPQALEIAIDDSERDAAGDNQQQLEEAKTRTLVSSSVVSHENAVFAAVKAGLAASSGVGVWSSATNDPIADIDAQIESIAIACGMMPNRIAFGIGAWRVFRSHAKVIARQPGAAVIGLTTAQAAMMTLNPAIEVKVGILSKDTAKFGAAKSTSNIVGAEVFVFYASPAPTQYDASFAKTFMGGAGGVDNVRVYRSESNRSDILAVDWSEDIVITSAACGRRITLS